jgi:hypothetical protein
LSDKGEPEPESEAESESLPFDVEIERLPVWTHVASACVLVVGVLVTAHLVPVVTFLPFLIASSIGRRLLHTSMHVEVHDSGISLGHREIPRAQIVDVWLDTDEAEARVTVHYSGVGGAERVDLAVLYFANRDQSVRFAEAASALSDNKNTTVAAGYRPRPVDLLSSLRFIAVGASFIESGRYLSLIVFAFGAMLIIPFFRAKQVIATAEAFTIHTAFGKNTGSSKEDVDAMIPRGSIRDTLLASPLWVERSRARVINHIQHMQQTRKGQEPLA